MRRNAPRGRIGGVLATAMAVLALSAGPAIPALAVDGSPAATLRPVAGLDPAADSDGDGLIDGAEDLDGDALSLLGELRFGSDPGDPDSDADGTPDGKEDGDGDGVSDALQQDRRPLPADLRPTLEQAWWDRPANYDDRCHNDAVDPELRACTFGAEGSDTSIVLFGDSHALQWLPALLGAAEQEGWQVTTLTKAACPPAQVEFGRKEPGAGASCLAWREQALAWLEAQPPDLLLLTGAGREYNLLGPDGQRLSDEAGLAAWQEGLSATLAAVPSATRTVVLADTPLMGRNPVSCLQEHPADQSACVTPRRDALAPGLDDAERAAAAAMGAEFETLGDLVCPYDPCPVVIGDVLLWRNADHITATFAEQLTPAMRALVLRHLPVEEGS